MEQEFYYQTILNQELDRRTKKDQNYSLRSFARFLGVDVGGLSKILSGKKLLTPEIAEKIAKNLALTPDQKRTLFFSMANAYKKMGRTRKGPIIKELIDKQNPEIVLGQELDPDTYSVISDWYHFAILQLAESAGFKANAAWIAKELNISVEQAELALDRLLSLGLLEKKERKLVRTFKKVHTGDQSFTSVAFKKRMKQVAEKSIEAIDEVDINLRAHNCITMAIDPKKIGVAKEMIREFMNDLSKVLQTKKKKVYELQVSLFPLQRTHEDD